MEIDEKWYYHEFNGDLYDSSDLKFTKFRRTAAIWTEFVSPKSASGHEMTTKF